MEVNSSGFERPIFIHYRPPWWLFYLYFLIHLLAIYCVYQSVLLLQFQFIFIIFISYNLFKESKKHFQLIGNMQSATLYLDKFDHWTLISNDNQQKLNLISVGFYSPYLIVLTFSGNKKRRHCFVITGELMDKESIRRLRVRLLYPI